MSGESLDKRVAICLVNVILTLSRCVLSRPRYFAEVTQSPVGPDEEKQFGDAAFAGVTKLFDREHTTDGCMLFLITISYGGLSPYEIVMSRNAPTTPQTIAVKYHGA